MIAAGCFLILAALICYGWSRDHKRANKAEQREALQAKVAASRLARIGSLELTVAAQARENAAQQEQIRYWQKWADDTDALLVAERFHAETNATALRGLLTNLARQELLRPDEASGNVVAFERAR